VEAGFEAVDLAPVAVAADADVEQAETLLFRHAVCHLAREHDHAGARGQHRQPVLDGAPQRLEQTHALQEHGHGRALASRQHQSAQTLEVCARPHQPRPRAARLERADVLCKSTLHGQDADER
jgi:hypothetical protein